jgi:L-alanine-DL-glutamate epimerase-like enolase superfamily enzyme
VNSDIRILEVEPFYTVEKAREPLKFGNVVVEECLFCHVRVRVENRSGNIAEGWGAIFLMDMWGWPTPKVAHADREEAMRRLNGDFCRAAAHYQGYAHPVDIFRELEKDLAGMSQQICADMKLAEEMPFLAALIAAAPVDAALHDAFGNVNAISTYDGYGPEFMTHDLSYHLGPKFRGKYIAHYLRKHNLAQIPIFHLVGGLDTLRRSGSKQGVAHDSLPQSLEEWIERDGLTCLKVKLRGSDLAWDVNRFLEVAQVAREVQSRQGKNELYFSADTNEQCENPQYMIEWIHKVQEKDPQALDALLYVEQPTERDLLAHRFDMRELSKLKPVILDESLTTLDDFQLAMELGWSGVALKTCKCQSSDLLFLAKAEEAGIPYTIQDLTNPGLALLQSVGLAARTHTIKGVEGNSRQYFPQISQPEAKVHPGIFRVENGQVATASLSGSGLGFRVAEIERDIFHRTESVR